MMLTAELLERAAVGDLPTLVELDARGLLMGAGESLSDYVERLRRLQENVAGMHETLAETGAYEVGGMRVLAGDRIPPELFAAAHAQTRALYGFEADWVPGFFVNPRHGWFFGGCAFYFYPDFFALFIIRKAFAERERWLIYSRNELLAHELCHVARIGMHSSLFEETLAYQTAVTRFRREMGSVFRSPTDSLLLLGSTLLLLLAQMLRTVWMNVPIAPFWLLVVFVAAYLGGRHWQNRRVFRRARENVAALAPDDPDAVLFRASDEEIVALAELDDLTKQREWVEFRAAACPRWRVTVARFCRGMAPADDSAAPVGLGGGDSAAAVPESDASVPADDDDNNERTGSQPTSGGD